jgi:hypothetical protein
LIKTNHQSAPEQYSGQFITTPNNIAFIGSNSNMSISSNTPSSAQGTNPPIAVWLCFAIAILEGFDIQAMGVAAQVPA